MLYLGGNNSYTGSARFSAARSSWAFRPPWRPSRAVSVAPGGTLDLNGQAINQTGPLTLNGAGVGGGGALINSGGTASYAGPIILGSPTTINFTTSRGTLGGNITGDGPLIVTGTACLTLGGSNTFSGGLSVTGLVAFTSDNQLGASGGPISLNGGALESYPGNNAAVISSARTITLGSYGGCFADANYGHMNIQSKVTGSGPLGIDYQTFGACILSSTNDYASDTEIGTRGPGYWGYGGSTNLKLGVANALPYGSGKGNVYVGYVAADDPTLTATLDLVGHSANINGLLSNNASHARVDNTAKTRATLTVGNADANSDFGGTIENTGMSGGLSLVKVGTGTLNLAGANTYSGTTIVNGGILELSNSAALSGSTFDASGTGSLSFTTLLAATFGGLQGTSGTLALTNICPAPVALSVGNGNNSTTFSGVMVDGGLGGSLTKIGTGRLTLRGTSTYSGGTTIADGVLQVGNTAALGTGGLAANGGTLDLAGYSISVPSLSGAAGTLTNSGPSAATLTVNQSAATMFSGTLTDGAGTFGLTTAGKGILTLTGMNACSGDTRVTGGTLQILSGRLPANCEYIGGNGINASFVQSGGTNAISSYFDIGQDPGIIGSYNLSGSGLLVSDNVESIGINGTGSFAKSGGTNAANGGLFLGSDATIAPRGNGTYNLSGSGLLVSTWLEIVGLSGTASFTQSGGTNAAKGGLMVGYNGGNGTYNLNGGLLQLATGPTQLSGSATFNLGGGTLAALSPWSSSLAMTLTGSGGNATIDTTVGDIGLYGALNGIGGLNKAGTGTLLLGGNNNYTGGTTIAGGTLAIVGQGILGGGNYPGAIANAGCLEFNSIRPQTISGKISGAGSLTQFGLGTLSLTNSANGYTGGTNILGGTLFVASSGALPGSGTVSVAAGATLSLGDGVARQTTVGGLSLGGSSTVALDWGDTLCTSAGAAASGYINLAPSGTFNSGTPYTLVTAGGGLSGAAGYLLNATNFTGAISVSATGVIVTPTAVAPLSTAYWYGGQVAAAPAAMALSNGTLSNWSTAPSYAATGLVPGSTSNVVFSGMGAMRQGSVVLGANMTVNSLTFSDTNAVAIGNDGNVLTLMSTASSASSAIVANQDATIDANLVLGADQNLDRRQRRDPHGRRRDEWGIRPDPRRTGNRGPGGYRQLSRRHNG